MPRRRTARTSTRRRNPDHEPDTIRQSVIDEMALAVAEGRGNAAVGLLADAVQHDRYARASVALARLESILGYRTEEIRAIQRRLAGEMLNAVPRYASIGATDQIFRAYSRL